MCIAQAARIGVVEGCSWPKTRSVVDLQHRRKPRSRLGKDRNRRHLQPQQIWPSTYVNVDEKTQDHHGVFATEQSTRTALLLSTMRLQWLSRVHVHVAGD